MQYSPEGHDDENFEDEDVEDEIAESSRRKDNVARAVEAARALGSSHSQSRLDYLADGLAELDMDHYDEEDSGRLHSTRNWNL